ncbi:hypothetical protein PM082_014727 [Marasmius tenuissimus]|nr:hypothetical protein PM082_014727 [Marasmius tenuissimus]
MALSPVSPVTATTPPPTSSVPSSTATDTNNSSSNPPSPTIATELTTSTSNTSRAKIIGGSIGGAGFLAVLIVIFLFLRKFRRRRNKQARDRLQDFDPAAAVIHPFTPTTLVLNPLSERKEPSSMPASNRKAVEGSHHRVTETTGKESSDPRQSHPEQNDESGQTSTLVDDNEPIDRASYRAMQAQMRLLMHKVERMEFVEEAPPEYVSAYGGSR